MYDLSVPNTTPGACQKCSGTGIYTWGSMVNGRMSNAGQCHSCRGTGKQDKAQIKRNRTYNRHKLKRLTL